MTLRPLALHPDRLFPTEPAVRAIARDLYTSVAGLPIISPHGHTDPAWFATNASFGNAAELLLAPDHYLFRMLYSQGVPLEAVGIYPRGNSGAAVEPREAWRVLAANYHLFRGTPSRMWLDWVFAEVFGLTELLGAGTSDHYFDVITHALGQDEFLPRALFEKFNIEVIATTEAPTDDLRHHAAIRESGWHGRVVTAYRPDPVVDPEFEGFRDNLGRLSDLTGEDCFSYTGYLAAHRKRRAFFAAHGATSTDHGHPTAATADLSDHEAEQLFATVTSGTPDLKQAELFRAHMLSVMAGMSVEDGLVMQIHPGSFRNHNRQLFERFGRDKGADIPMRTDYVHALRPLLDRYGNDPSFSLIVFTLDETAYARELAPLAGHYPALKLGPAWWFHDSPEGMRRFRGQVTETAGFYNTVGFNDDTRAFLSIPARHDVARRIDCGFLAQLVAEHRLQDWEAAELALDLSYNLAKAAYKTVRLSPEMLGSLAPSVGRFDYDREAQAVGIVHLGIGAFHRAHQAVYTDLAMSAGDRDWAICGVSLRSSTVRDQLIPQGSLYSLTEREGSEQATRVVGSLRSVVVGVEEPAAVMDAIGSPLTRIVTVTVTEKGYHGGVGGGLAIDAPDIVHDLSGAPGKRTIYGYLATGLARRRAAGLAGLTLVSCDNLAGNGPRLAAHLGQFLDIVDPALRAWFERECACPATMVDRIVPATTPDQIDALEARTGFRDEAAVLTERFSQWVIEDRFAGSRPRWELAGAQFVDNVVLYEDAKLRMLNGAHSALAYLGLQAGHTYVHEAIADRAIRPLIVRLMLEEAAPTLPSTQEFDPQDYAARLLDRFANSALAHRLDQIAMDGSQKIPQRWFPSLQSNQQEGRRCPAILEALAAWMLHVRSGEAVDPMSGTLARLWSDAGTRGIANVLVGPGGLFSGSWTASEDDLQFLRNRLERAD